MFQKKGIISKARDTRKEVCEAWLRIEGTQKVPHTFFVPSFKIEDKGQVHSQVGRQAQSIKQYVTLEDAKCTDLEVHASHEPSCCQWARYCYCSQQTSLLQLLLLKQPGCDPEQPWAGAASAGSPWTFACCPLPHLQPTGLLI